MNKENCHKLIDERYPDPVLKTWEPSEIDMKYHYNTPRRLKKLDADRAKENSKLKAVYDNAVREKSNVHKVVDRIANYPVEISDMFLDSFLYTVMDIERRHQRFTEFCSELTTTYGEEALKHFPDLKYLFEAPSSWNRRQTSYNIIDQEKFQKWANDRCNSYRKCFIGITDVDKLFRDYRTWIELRDADDIHTQGASAFRIAICHIASVLNRICDEINEIFEGNVPTKCITDPHWGLDGHFNGILTDGNKKASFKSFGAGGYNIQRFHYRFKITELKR